MKTRIIALFIFGSVLAAGSVLAQDEADIVAAEVFVYEDNGRRDPFWPLVTDGGSIISYDDQELSASDMMLQGILVGEQENVAVINGNIVKEGDMVGAFWIERVMPAYVVLNNGQERIEVYLRKEE